MPGVKGSSLISFTVCLATVIGFKIAAADPPKPSTTPAAAPSPIKRTCDAAEFRQFDFWLGSWTVRNIAGKEVGTSQVTKIAGTCGVLEQWKAVNGISGISINYFDRDQGQWHQDWVGSGGNLHLQGRFENGAMVLSDLAKQIRGTPANRIIWTALPDGKVKQEWSTSSDGGKTWTASFIGLYEQ